VRGREIVVAQQFFAPVDVLQAVLFVDTEHVGSAVGLHHPELLGGQEA
jgi:hypothetical protein